MILFLFFVKLNDEKKQKYSTFVVQTNKSVKIIALKSHKASPQSIQLQNELDERLMSD